MRLLPYAGIALAVAGALWWAHGRGVQSERGKWQAAAIVAERAAVARSAAMQAQVDAAGAALSEKQAQIDIAARAMSDRTRVFYVQNPARNVACLDAGRLRHIAEADAALEAASPAR